MTEPGEKTKIVIIGAGSASFGPSILGDLMKCKALRGSTVALCDLNPDGLDKMTRLAQRLNQEWDSGMVIKSSTDRGDLLPGASFVIVSIAVDREECWRQDWEIPAKYGIRQPLGENGGPGAFFQTARNVLPILDICRDMESLCPQALLMNFTNPVPRLTWLANHFSKIKAVGLCHQIGMGYRIAGLVLAQDLGLPAIPTPEDEKGIFPAVSPYLDPIYSQLDIKAAGINHFTFMLDIRYQNTGEDLYPLFQARLKQMPAYFQPLSRRIYDAFGVFPATGDGHLSEYVHWAHWPLTEPWKKYRLHLCDWDAAERGRDRMWGEIDATLAGGPLMERLQHDSGEAAIPVIVGMLENRNQYEVAVDVPNDGYISNLPDGAVVEVPAVISRLGVRGLGIGALPEGIAALCRTQITVAQLSVEAAVTGDRHLALQALLVDPMVNDMDQAKALLDEMLSVQAAYLPQFS